ncbi:MAG: long-chain fatty acid--CoA ligase [Actinobacteria bacterium]|nr:MAG: long-chain fatty acid--CoA ligase [Actinomycetota bacterium]
MRSSGPPSFVQRHHASPTKTDTPRSVHRLTRHLITCCIPGDLRHPRVVDSAADVVTVGSWRGGRARRGRGFLVATDGTETAVTWQTLESRANQIARRLEALGAKKDSVVCLALPTCVEHITVTLAIWKLGATLLPLRHDQPQWEMDRLLAVAQPQAMISDEHTATCSVLSRADLSATMALPDHPLEDHIRQ